MENEVLNLCGIQIKVFRKKMKTLRLVVKSATDVRISVPKNYPQAQIVRFVTDKADWILQNIEKFKTQKSNIAPKNGDVMHILGRPFVLQVRKGARNGAKCTGGVLILMVRENTPEMIEKSLKIFCKRVLKAALPAYFEKWQRATGLVVKGFSVRDMKSRWGSCNTKKQTISINVQVALKPLECLDYLVLHEVAHIFEPSHNQNFKDFLSRFMPDWKDRRKMLKK